MKKVLSLLVLVCFVAGVATFQSCKKKPDPPTVTTTAISNLTTTGATSGGNVTSDGGAEVTAKGVCWGTATKPLVTGSKTSDGTGTGSFTSTITGLTSNTLYYVRAYATNSEGTSYGNELSFTTAQVVGATLTTTAVTAITATTAASGGNITADGGAPVTARGVCWATTANPTTSNSKTTDGSGNGTFTSSITGLTAGTVYHVRAYATNSFGTAYGNDVQFTSAAVIPTVTTTAVTAKTQTTATLGGNVTANGGAAVTARGVAYGTSASPTIAGSHTSDGTGDGVFTSNLAGLTPGTLYYARAYATNSVGTAYGSEVQFTTDPVLLATVTTATPASVNNNSAVGGGEVTADGGGTVTERGVCWGTATGPTIAGSHVASGSGTGTFTANLTSLPEATTIYIRAYATNSVGTAYGNEVSARTLLADVEGNLYHTIVIGTQVWMSENLKTTKYNDNVTNVTLVTDNATWAALTSEAYCWYGNDEATNKPIYGALYNWYAATHGDLCPAGWHVPTDAEFKTLEMFLGMTQAQADGFSWRGTDQGTQLKNTTGWTTGNGTNTSGFSALPGGYRYYFDGGFAGLGTIGYFWSSDQASPTNGLYRRMDGANAGVFREGAVKSAGKAVRCIKN
ncbi:MAG: fibrobacter succinogenes major paralogous domain-containing protein [Bacteroidota bacterium]|nr:fibrobacter succinogenes major paralogous domain-containing protein [Bacteroidota bacterium]